MLRQYLVDLPQNINYKPSAIPYNLHAALYTSAAGTFINELFPQDQPYSLSDPCIDPPNGPYYSMPQSRSYSHPPDKVCARVVSKGEPTYRCRQCGHDDTCVLCGDCFNKEDHIGHEVMVAMSQGDGLCDCGDLEAFPKLNCRCAVDVGGPQPFTNSVEETLRVCMDYILDVMNFSIQTLPFVHENQRKGIGALTPGRLSEYATFENEVNSDGYVLILWNDERHNLKEADTAIVAATGVDQATSDQLINTISSEGCASLKRASTWEELVESKKAAEINGLVATICSERDHIRELVVFHILVWITEVLSFPTHPAFRETCKTALAEILLEPHQLSKVLPNSFFREWAVDLRRKFFESGMLYDGKIVNYGLTKVKDGFSYVYNPVHTVLEVGPIHIEHSRIQYLLLFQMRFMTAARKRLPKLLAPLLADAQAKSVFTRQMMAVYPGVLTSLAYSDREDHLNLLSEVSTQLLSCPTSVQSLQARDEVGRIVGPLAKLIEDRSSRYSESTGCSIFVEDPDSQKVQYFSVKQAILRGMNDIRYIASHPEARAALLAPNNLTMFLFYLRHFQDYCPLVRKYGNHVEHESFEYAVHYEYSIKVLETVKDVAASRISREEAAQAMRRIVGFLMSRTVPQSAPGIADFCVSKDPVAFVHPVHTLLSCLVRQHGFDVFREVVNDTALLNITDIALRSIVLGAQVKVCFWIRNGMSASRQASLYMNSRLTELTLFCDLHIQQIGLCLDNPRTALYNMLDRWELLGWYRGEVDWKNTIYEDRFGLVVEKFVVFLYNIFTNREIENTTEREEEDMLRSLCYFLCDAPKSFSQISAHVHGDVEHILHQIADYQPPTGLSDVGLYRLKPSAYEGLDPMSLYLDSSKFQVVSDALYANLAKTSGRREDELVLMPVWQMSRSDFVNDSLARFTKTRDFIKLMYKLLSVAIDSKEETFLAQLLHLLHACLIDDERMHGTDYLREDYVNISIGNLLLTIAQSQASKRVRTKAAFLLESLIQKDSRVFQNLVDSFGEEHMRSYKEASRVSHDKSSKLRSEKRKAKVMRSFAKQRKRFLSNNKDLEAPTDTDSLADSHHLGTCVYCGEPESSRETFGVMATKTVPMSMWHLPKDDPGFYKLAFASYEHQQTPRQGLYGRGLSLKKHAGPTTHVLSTCGHGIHYRCFNREMRGMAYVRYVPCPLCHNLHELFVPVFVAKEVGVPVPQDVDDTMADPAIYKSVGTTKSASLVGAIAEQYSPAVMKDMALVAMKEIVPHSDTTPGAFYSVSSTMAQYIANIVRMHEIATRIEGPECFPSLLSLVPSTAKALVRALVQCRALLYELRGSAILLGSNYSLDLETAQFWRSSAISSQDSFIQLVTLFLQTDESFSRIVTHVLVKTIASAVASLSKVPVMEHADRPLSDAAKQTLLQIHISKGWSADEGSISSLYLAIERLCLPLLRQSLLLLDILSSSPSHDQSHSDMSTRLQDLVDAQAYPDCSDALTTLLGIPSLESVLGKIAQESTNYSQLYLDTLPSPVRLAYPGVVKLIDLPKDYNDCVMDDDPHEHDSLGFENIVCLHCGTKVKDSRFLSHMANCSNSSGIFFVPRLNNLKICIHVGHSPIHVDIPAPYLTQHGECKRLHSGGKATLNDLRYKYLNSLWLTQGLYGFVTRRLFGSQVDTWSIDDQEEDEDDGMDHGFV